MTTSSLSQLAEELTRTTSLAMPPESVAPPAVVRVKVAVPRPSVWGRLAIGGALALLTTLGYGGYRLAGEVAALVEEVRIQREERRAAVPLPARTELLDEAAFTRVLATRRPEAVRLLLARATVLASVNRWADAGEAYAAAAGQAAAGLPSPAQVAWAEALVRSGAISLAAERLAKIDGAALAEPDRRRLHRVVADVHLMRRMSER